MLVTLLENVASLGAEGQAVEVPDGYATRFLFPQHLAVEGGKKEEDAAPAKAPSKAEREEEQMAADIDGLEVVVPVKVVKGKLKEKVTATEIRRGLKELGYAVEKSAIKTDAIESLGSFDVPVEFGSGFESQIKVSVEAA